MSENRLSRRDFLRVSVAAVTGGVVAAGAEAAGISNSPAEHPQYISKETTPVELPKRVDIASAEALGRELSKRDAELGIDIYHTPTDEIRRRRNEKLDPYVRTMRVVMAESVWDQIKNNKDLGTDDPAEWIYAQVEYTNQLCERVGIKQKVVLQPEIYVLPDKECRKGSNWGSLNNHPSEPQDPNQLTKWRDLIMVTDSDPQKRIQSSPLDHRTLILGAPSSSDQGENALPYPGKVSAGKREYIKALDKEVLIDKGFPHEWPGHTFFALPDWYRSSGSLPDGARFTGNLTMCPGDIMGGFTDMVNGEFSTVDKRVIQMTTSALSEFRGIEGDPFRFYVREPYDIDSRMDPLRIYPIRSFVRLQRPDGTSLTERVQTVTGSTDMKAVNGKSVTSNASDMRLAIQDRDDKTYIKITNLDDFPEHGMQPVRDPNVESSNEVHLSKSFTSRGGEKYELPFRYCSLDLDDGKGTLPIPHHAFVMAGMSGVAKNGIRPERAFFDITCYQDVSVVSEAKDMFVGFTNHDPKDIDGIVAGAEVPNADMYVVWSTKPFLSYTQEGEEAFEAKTKYKATVPVVEKSPIQWVSNPQEVKGDK